MKTKILFVTPPFTQLNTPYPATAYLKGYFNTLNTDTKQLDLSIELINRIFCSSGLSNMFASVTSSEGFSTNSNRIFRLRSHYISCIDDVMQFLQGSNSGLEHLICSGNYLPEASRFTNTDDIDWAFGSMGIKEKAKYLATLFLEDISDFISEVIDSDFGFSRYAESIGRSAYEFDDIENRLKAPDTIFDREMLDILSDRVEEINPDIVAYTIPFPGNLYGALRCGEWLKRNRSDIKIVFGGGFVNTELRELTDSRIFDFTDFITLDDGETPLRNIVEYIDGTRSVDDLKRTFINRDSSVVYINGSSDSDVKQKFSGVPDYSDLPLDKYISVIEVANPMHALWSNGRWNKLTLAHGCYWAKCSFCDGSLDYIGRYEPNKVGDICDRIEQIIEQTGYRGFHFVDEAAPPALLRELSLELLRRRLNIVWWTNVRFEQNYTADLCRLMKESGCIAVSGGLEVASDRILKLINKGVSIDKVAVVADNFTQSGILIHTYLMYGFPTQTAQETVDSLEVVRQLFEAGVVQSGFWHRFAMTVHSPVGKNPEQFGVSSVSDKKGSFANNDVEFEDNAGADHVMFGEGLRKSLFNFMHGMCFDYKAHEWFDFKVPSTSLPRNMISRYIEDGRSVVINDRMRVVWLGEAAYVRCYIRKKKGKKTEMCELVFSNKTFDCVVNVKQKTGLWLNEFLNKVSVSSGSSFNIQDMRQSFENADLGDFDLFISGYTINTLKENGLLFL